MAKFDIEKAIEIYVKKGFNVSETCVALGVSRQHFYLMKKKHQQFAEGLSDAREQLIDEIEDALIKSAKDGHIVAQIFFLKTQAKDRGYNESVDINLKEKLPPVQLLLPDNGRNKT